MARSERLPGGAGISAVDIGADIVPRIRCASDTENETTTLPRSMRLVLSVVWVVPAGAGLARVTEVETTMVVNVGDDEITYGLHVSPDLDTVIYTLAGIEGPEGWGRADDTWEVMGHLAALGVDTAFAIGDSDLATNLFRTLRLRQRETLSAIAADMAARFGVTTTVLPASD